MKKRRTHLGPASLARGSNDARSTSRRDLTLAGNQVVMRLHTGASRPHVARMIDENVDAGTPLVNHRKQGDDPGWTLEKIEAGKAVVKKGDVTRVIDVPTFDWSPVAESEEGRKIFLQANPVTWTAPELQKWAAFQYTASKYKAINAVASGKDPDGEIRADLDRWLKTAQGIPPDMTVDSLIAHLGDALAGLSDLPEDVKVLTKGVNLEEHSKIEPRYTVNDHKLGQVYEVGEFTSTSEGNPFTDRDSLIVYYRNGRHAGKRLPDDYTPSGNEQEVLFPPGLRYVVLEVIDKDTTRFEEMKKTLGVAGPVPKLNRIVRVEIQPPRTR